MASLIESSSILVDMVFNELQIRIIEELKMKDLSRSELVNLLEEPRTTIYESIEKLIELNIVEKYTPPHAKIRGRPLRLYRLLVR